MSNVKSHYLGEILTLDGRKEVLDNLKKRLKKLDFDTIVFSGMSGALIAPSLADALKKKLVMVRKDSDITHSCYRLEGDLGGCRYIIIDDQISSGETIKRIIRKMKEEDSQKELVGVHFWKEEYHCEYWDDEVNIAIAKATAES